MTSNHYLFIDETGTSSLKNVNKDFPYFLLCGVLIDEKSYIKLSTQINDLKISFFGTSDIILHSRDIRRIDGPFKILFDDGVKEEFYNATNTILAQDIYTIFYAYIHIDMYIQHHGYTHNSPYTICLKSILEDIYIYTKSQHISGIDVYVEKRGSDQDALLIHDYNIMRDKGTGILSSQDIRETISGFSMSNKSNNDIGIQVADLCAYPIISYIRNPLQDNQAYQIIQSKIYKK